MNEWPFHFDGCRLISKRVEMYFRLIFLSLISVGAGSAQIPHTLKEITEIGLIGTEFDERPSASLGSATAFPDGVEGLRIEGFDDNQKPWRLFLPRSGVPISRMHVYRADLDANRRADLLFSDVVIGNGRCVADGSVTTLMFDEVGRPVPWRMDNQALVEDGRVPVLMADLNGDTRAEIVTSDCRYARHEKVELAEDRWITGIYEARDTRWVPLRPESIEPYLLAIKERFPEFEPGFLEWLSSPEPLSPDRLDGLGERLPTKLTGLLSSEIGCDYMNGPPGSAAAEGGCTRMQMSSRTRYADGSVWAGWPPVIFDSPSGREIHFSKARENLETVMKAGLAVRIVGAGQTASYLWSDEAASSSTREIECGLAARVTESKAIKWWEQDVEEETGEEETLHFDTGAFTQPRPIETSAVRTRLPEKQQPPKGRYFSRDGRCFFMPFVESGDKAVREVEDCSKLPSLALEAKSGERILLNSRDNSRRLVSPKQRSFRSLKGYRSPVDGVIKEVRFQEIPGYSGEVVGAVDLEAQWLVQWRGSDRSWFVLHDEEGKPLTKALELEVAGELFDATLYSGAEFLGWHDGEPVEWLKVNVAFEWTVED